VLFFSGEHFLRRLGRVYLLISQFINKLLHFECLKLATFCTTNHILLFTCSVKNIETVTISIHTSRQQATLFKI